MRKSWRVGWAARVEVPIWPTGTLTLVAVGDSGLPPLELALLKGLPGAGVGSWGHLTASNMSPSIAEKVVPCATSTGLRVHKT